MACMCGDLRCWSCGPAQGNYKCSQCGKWSDEGGCEQPEVCGELDRQQAEAEAKYYAEMDAAEKDYEQFLRERGE